MSRVRRVLSTSTVALALVAAAVAGSGGAGAVPSPAGTRPGATVERTAPPPSPARTASQRGDRRTTVALAEHAGLQVGVKHTRRPTVRVGGRTYPAPNPYLAELPSGTHPDWAYWRSHRARTALARARAQAARPPARRVPTPTSWAESEPRGSVGENDSLATSEHLTDVGVGAAFQAARISGRLSGSTVPTYALSTREDQGSIPRATRTRIGATRPTVLVRSRIGDGRHGSARENTGDFDFFRVRVLKGQTLQATTRGSTLDTVLTVYDAKGRIVAANDDALDDTDVFSTVEKRVTRTATYYVMVSGYSDSGSVPQSPFRPGSGSGAGVEGRYTLRISAQHVDQDFYGVHLGSGDVLAGRLTGAATTVGVSRTDGRRMVTSTSDFSSFYPVTTQLTGGAASFAYVAAEPGWYAVSVQQGTGAYQLLVETSRPGPARRPAGAAQTVFLDFDGARLNTFTFGGPGVVTLSPLSRFLPRWGLTPEDLPAVQDAVVAGVEENLRTSLVEQGLNPDVAVRIRDSGHDADPFGGTDVSRVVVGGTVAQSGVDTLGIAQSIDPGNDEGSETAMLLLDRLSAPAGPEDSLNTYLRPRSHRVAFLGQALGNAVSHEVGHLLGSFHTDNDDARSNLMDAGGQGFGRLFGVGPDGVGGTADDTDVDFGVDAYLPAEGLAGQQDTLNTSAWAFLPGAGS